MIIVMGIPGAGKSTVLSEALKLAPGWRAVNWGDRMVELGKKRKFVSGRDEIRKLPFTKQAELQKAVALSLAKEKGKWILDTHCSVNTPDGYFPGLPFSLLGKLKADRLVLIEAPIESIVRRRSKDKTRARDAQPLEKIMEQLFVNKSLVCAYSAFSGAPVTFIMNEEGKAAEAAAFLAKFLE